MEQELARVYNGPPVPCQRCRIWQARYQFGGKLVCVEDLPWTGRRTLA